MVNAMVGCLHKTLQAYRLDSSSASESWMVESESLSAMLKILGLS